MIIGAGCGPGSGGSGTDLTGDPLADEKAIELCHQEESYPRPRPLAAQYAHLGCGIVTAPVCPLANQFSRQCSARHILLIALMGEGLPSNQDSCLV